MSESENLLGRIVSRRASLCVQASAAAEDRNSSHPLGQISNLLVIDTTDPLRLSGTLQSLNNEMLHRTTAHMETVISRCCE